MPLNDVLNCTAEELWTILDSDQCWKLPRWFLSKRVDMIAFSQLGEMLSVGSYDELMAGFQLVGEPREDGPWPQTIPPALIQRLAAISDEEIATVAPLWAKTEEFHGVLTTEDLSCYLKELRTYLRGRSDEFFLVCGL